MIVADARTRSNDLVLLRWGANADDVWLRAARTGLDDQDLAKAARVCFAAADSALAVPGTPAVLRYVLADFAERYQSAAAPPPMTIWTRTAAPDPRKGTP